MIRRRHLFIASAAAFVTACVGQGARPTDRLVQLYARPDRNEWPEQFAQLSVETQDMYRYAVANKPVLQWMPCFCGCVNGGHTSNYDCYVRSALPDGRVVLDTMSFG
jgi:hypothetical protein